jgi:uncharacterized membrane protein SpoIIM required for sporulation
MVLEQIVNTQWLQRRPWYAVGLGLVYTLIGFVTGYLFFRENLSISVLFLITLLLVPSLMNLLSIQEEKERKSGPSGFFKNHKDVFSTYFFLSVGIFIGYLVIIFSMNYLGMELSSTLSEQIGVFGEALTGEKIESFDINLLYHAFSIFIANLGVAVIFFVLSFFYGAGSIFLIVWNASIFSTFITITLQNISRGVNHSIGLLGAFSVYVIPEIGGFLLAGIAGGVVSKALVTEGFMTPGFRNVLRDAMSLLLVAFVMLIVAAFLESYVAVNLIRALV